MSQYNESLPAVTAILPAAGIGSRMQALFPKQYLSIGDKTIIEHAIGALLRHSRVQRVIVAISAQDDYFSQLPIATDPRITVVTGGAQRVDSVLSALQQVDQVEWVLVHDAARPCLHQDDLERLLALTQTSTVGGILAAPVRDTMKRAQRQREDQCQQFIDHTIDRQDLWHALTPQLFPRDLLMHCLTAAVRHNPLAVTDEASALEFCGYTPQLVAGRADNIKVTLPEDLALATFYLTQLSPGV